MEFKNRTFCNYSDCCQSVKKAVPFYSGLTGLSNQDYCKVGMSR